MAASFTDMLKRGWDYLLVAEVEGIPYLFAERKPQRVDGSGANPTLPSEITSVSESLLIRQGDTISQVIANDQGYAAGVTFAMRLSREVLEDESLESVLFKQPSVTALLDDDVSVGDATITVDSTTGWPAAPDYFWLGREYIKYAGKTATTFTGCTRAIRGYEYESLQTSSGSYAEVCVDVPAQWRGRYVTLHAHIVSPEGRIVDSTWLTGTYHRIMWRGFIDVEPRPKRWGMEIRCLPLTRLAEVPLGAPLTAKTLGAPTPAASDNYPVVIGPETIVFMSITVEKLSDGSQTTHTAQGGDVSVQTLSTVGHWRQLITDAIFAAWGGLAWFYDAGGGTVQVNPATYRVVTASATSVCYWLRSGVAPSSPGGFTVLGAPDTLGGPTFAPKATPGEAVFGGPIQPRPLPGAWLPVVNLEGLGLMATSIPSTGVGIVSSEGNTEAISWDQSLVGVGVTALRISGRQLGAYLASPPANLRVDADFSLAAGARGPIGTIIRRILSSSNTGNRGADDTEAVGHSVPAAWINIPDALPLGSYDIAIYEQGGKASLERMTGGWIWLSGHAVAMRRNASSGELQLTLVGSQPTNLDLAIALTTADVEIDQIAAKTDLDTPNAISLKGDNGVPDMIVGSTIRMAQEGSRVWEASLPGATIFTIAAYATSIVALATGRAEYEVLCGPWVDADVGDIVDLQLSHPMFYDWNVGGWAPSSALGVVVGRELDLWSGRVKLRVDVAAAVPLASHLCPTAIVNTETSTTIIDVDPGEGVWFTDGDVVTIYNAGDETGGDKGTQTISTVVGDTITFTGATPGWFGVGSYLTWPPHGSATTAQKNGWLFIKTDQNWRQ